MPAIKMSSFSNQIGRGDDSNVPWVPAETDTTPRAIDWRARRAMRIAVDVRETLGHPTTVLLDGSVNRATGLWGILEPLKAMADDWNAQKKARSEVKGFFATRGEKVFDRLLIMLVVAFVGYCTRQSWVPGATVPGAAPATPAAAVPAEKH
jgi:hypothetical protein